MEWFHDDTAWPVSTVSNGSVAHPAILWCFPASVFLRSSFGDLVSQTFTTNTYCWQFLLLFLHNEYIFLGQSVTLFIYRLRLLSFDRDPWLGQRSLMASEAEPYATWSSQKCLQRSFFHHPFFEPMGNLRRLHHETLFPKEIDNGF